MQLRDRNLKVFYRPHVDPKVNEKLDEALEALLKTFGYERWASGYNIPDDVRDLAFENRLTAVTKGESE